MNSADRKRSISYYSAYTALFILLFFLCFGIYLLIYGKSLIRYTDALEMHYVSYVYARRAIMEFFHSGTVSLWEPASGYGTDSFLFFAAYLTDPVYLITYVIPEKFSEYGFSLTYLIRFYLAGLAFSYLSLKRGNDHYSTLCGAVVYVFSSCALTGLQQSGFIVPLYMFPLLIAAADELFDKKKPVLYVAVLSFFAISNFYFVYMSAILVVIYCLLKWFWEYDRKKTIGEFLRIVGRFALFSLWSAANAAFSLIPIALTLRQAGRLELERYVPLFYDASFYKKAFQGFVSGYDMLDRDSRIGYSVLALICIFALFVCREKVFRKIRIEFILMTAALMLPSAGYLMNAFNYPANRWAWGYGLLVSYIVVIMIPKIRGMSRKQKIIISVCGVIYMILGFTVLNAYSFTYPFIVILLIAASAGILLAERIQEKAYKIIVLCLTCVSVIYFSFFQCTKSNGNFFSDFVPSGKALYLLTDFSGLNLLDDACSTSGSRYGHSGTVYHFQNSSILTGMSGIDFYNNIYNNNVDRFHQDISLNANMNFRYAGLDDRSDLMHLMGVKYYISGLDDTTNPVGYDTLCDADSATGYRLLSYDGQRTLFTSFKSTVAESGFEALDPYAMQQVLMNYCVVEDGYGEEGVIDPDLFDGDRLEYSLISADDGNTFDSDGMTIEGYSGESQITLSIPEQSDAELYVYIGDLVYGDKTQECYGIYVEGLYDGEPAGMKELIYGFTPFNHMYAGKEDWLVCLGRISGKVNMIKFTFEKPGRYDFSELSIYAEPESKIEENISKLDQDFGDISVNGDQVMFSRTCEQSEYVLISIPYSDGWTAEDNGKPADIIRADVGFMAVKLDPGTHNVVLKYKTPGLKSGVCISVISVISFITAGVLLYRNRSKET